MNISCLDKFHKWAFKSGCTTDYTPFTGVIRKRNMKQWNQITTNSNHCLHDLLSMQRITRGYITADTITSYHESEENTSNAKYILQIDAFFNFFHFDIKIPFSYKIPVSWNLWHHEIKKSHERVLLAKGWKKFDVFAKTGSLGVSFQLSTNTFCRNCAAKLRKQRKLIVQKQYISADLRDLSCKQVSNHKAC